MDILSQGITEEIYQNLYMGSEREMMWHCNADPRFSYHTYIPENYREYKEKKLKLISFVHGTGRTIEWYRSLFKDFADKNGWNRTYRNRKIKRHKCKQGKGTYKDKKVGRKQNDGAGDDL